MNSVTKDLTGFENLLGLRLLNKKLISSLKNCSFGFAELPLVGSFACPKETNQRKGQKIYTEPSHMPLLDTDIFSDLRIRQLAEFCESIQF